MKSEDGGIIITIVRGVTRLGPSYRAVAVQSRWSASPDLTLCPLEIKVKTWPAG